MYGGYIFTQARNIQFFVFYTIDRYSDIKKKTNYWFDKNFD